MAIASIHVSVISRGKGHSAVAAAAYRAGEEIQNDYDGILHDYSRKQGIVHAELFVPDHAPDWATDRSHLWNSVEQVEKSSNSRLAREIYFALPKELTREQNIALATEYAKQFAQDGMVADVSVHDKEDGNPHAHLMLTTRPFDHEGNWAEKSRKEYVLDNNGERIRLPSGEWKSRKVDTVDWNHRDNVEKWREQYTELTNQYLERYGHAERIDHRSYERQGIDQEPTIHLGSYAHRLEQQGIQTDRGNINRQIQERNQIRNTVEQEITLLAQELNQTQIDIEREKSKRRQRYNQATERYRKASQTHREPRHYAKPKDIYEHYRQAKEERETQQQPHHEREPRHVEQDPVPDPTPAENKPKDIHEHYSRATQERNQRQPHHERHPRPEHKVEKSNEPEH